MVSSVLKNPRTQRGGSLKMQRGGCNVTWLCRALGNVSIHSKLSRQLGRKSSKLRAIGLSTKMVLVGQAQLRVLGRRSGERHFFGKYNHEVKLVEYSTVASEKMTLQ